MRCTLLLSIMLIALSGCSRPTVDARLAPFLAAFKVASRASVLPPVNMTFVDGMGSYTQGNLLDGQCQHSTTGMNTVLINSQTFFNYPAQVQTAIVFHELGHCILNRQHRTDVDSGGNPLSIMYPYPDLVYWNTDAEYQTYLNELFGR
jgi:hypothetical protein